MKFCIIFPLPVAAFAHKQMREPECAMQFKLIGNNYLLRTGWLERSDFAGGENFPQNEARE
jgi:hypothetical protein